jgi:hypothetical protein
MALTRIGTSAIEDSAVTTAKINDGAVTQVKTTDVQTTLTYTSGTFTGDGSTAAITISSGRSVNDVVVDVNGVIFTPTTDYTISGTTLTFSTAPISGAEITVRYLPINT